MRVGLDFEWQFVVRELTVWKFRVRADVAGGSDGAGIRAAVRSGARVGRRVRVRAASDRHQRVEVARRLTRHGFTTSAFHSPNLRRFPLNRLQQRRRLAARQVAADRITAHVVALKD
ncbi:hypothetical protein BSZ39_00140 [Bowdeniella nasicola]|uniref:Uncharacterized protein n=1 Tax=Bowdeniella nasicola TaxID=208480 RepID=A0A1Q5Q6A0_9ACTO|nr:hypothetical protein [Bowdeniella nasicola]OKL55150.1 hypothetical protein BSZ39_00140 [Bowdeniella nasicola]